MQSFLQLLPDMPWWVTLAILVPGAIYALLLLAMPFGVFGLKSRLDQIEGQLAEIREDLQAIAARLPNRAAPSAFAFGAEPAEEPPSLRAPVEPPVVRERSEPRLDWRR
jgi:hypothetical protein